MTRPGSFGWPSFTTARSTLSLLEMGEYDEAAQWLHRADDEFEAFVPRGDSAIVEEYQGLQALYHVGLL